MKTMVVDGKEYTMARNGAVGIAEDGTELVIGEFTPLGGEWTLVGGAGIVISVRTDNIRKGLITY